MAYTTVDIANAALVKIGARPIVSIDDDLTEARAVKNRYQQVFDYVLSLYPFTSTLHRVMLTRDADYTKAFEYDYSFPLPADCLHVWEVVDADGDQLFDFSKEGQAILANLTSIGILYARRITGKNLIDHDVGELLSFFLAAELSERIDPEPRRTQQLKEQAEFKLAQIRTSDARRQAPRFYGAFDPFNKHQNDQPETWLDSRL